MKRSTFARHNAASKTTITLFGVNFLVGSLISLYQMAMTFHSPESVIHVLVTVLSGALAWWVFRRKIIALIGCIGLSMTQLLSVYTSGWSVTIEAPVQLTLSWQLSGATITVNLFAVCTLLFASAALYLVKRT